MNLIQFAARLSALEEPDLLVLLASLPDVPEVESLRKAGTATVIGWKARILVGSTHSTAN